MSRTDLEAVVLLDSFLFSLAVYTGTLRAARRTLCNREYSTLVMKMSGKMNARYFIVLNPSVGRPNAVMICMNIKLKYILPTSHDHMDVPAEYCCT